MRLIILCCLLVNSLVAHANTYNPQSLIKAVFLNNHLYEDYSDTIRVQSDDLLLFLFDSSADSSFFYYQLINYNQHIKKTALPIAPFSDLKQGVYEFYVSQNQSFLNKKPIVIIVHNSIFNAWWFIGLFFFYVLLLIGGSAYFIRLSNFRNKGKLLDLRNDWTNKLHNDLGGDLSSVSLRLSTLQKQLATADPAIYESTLKTFSILKEVQHKLRFVFDLVDPKKNSMEVMLNDVITFANENYALQNIQFHYNITFEHMENLSIDIGRTNKIYLIMKEVINNSIKHSKATSANICINKWKSGLEIIITDNGIGFDLNATYAGNGLQNLKQYANDGFMDLKIETKPKHGTTIDIKIPNL